MTFFVPFCFYLILNAGTTSVLHGKAKFGLCLPVTMIGSALVMMLGQFFFHSYTQAYHFLLALSLLSVPLSIWSCRRQAGRKAMFSAGFYAFLIICLVFAVIDWHRHFSETDEWYHWGMMVKESLRTDRFYSDPSSNLFLHKDYPPFACLLEVLWCKLGGGFSEQGASMALHIFMFSMLLPWFSESIDSACSCIQHFHRNFCLLMICFAVVLAFEPGHMLISILLDVPLPILFAAAMMMTYTETAFEFPVGMLSYLLLQISMVLSKQVGWGFVMVCSAFCLLYKISTQKKQPGSLRIAVLCSAGGLVLPGVFYGIWSHYVHGLGLTGQFSLSSISLQDYMAALIGRANFLKNDTIRRYARALFKTDIGRISFLPVSYLSAFGLVMVLVFILARRHAKEDQPVFAALGASFICGSIGYAFMMSVLYLFCFSSVEMKALASYQRYMVSWLAGEMLVLALITVHYESQAEKGILRSPVRLAAVAVSALVLLGSTNCYYLMPRALWDDRNRSYKEIAAALAAKVPSQSRVFLIDDMKKHKCDLSTMEYYIGYYDNDLQISHAYTNAFECDPANSSQVEFLSRVIRSNEYLYLIDKPSWMDNLFASQLQELKSFSSGSVYRIEKLDNWDFRIYPTD